MFVTKLILKYDSKMFVDCSLINQIIVMVQTWPRSANNLHTPFRSFEKHVYKQRRSAD